MTNETDSFVQEVDESLRQDRVLEFFKKWGLWLAGAFVLVIAVIGGWQVWKSYNLNQAREHSVEYSAAQQQLAGGDVDGAKAEFERLAGEGPSNYRVMARMEHAAILVQQGDLDAALTEFDAAAEAASDPIMRQTAQMRAAYIAAETQDFAALQTRLQPIIDSESRFSYLARELLAIEAWEAGNADLARENLQALTLALQAPESLRQRAQIASQVVGPALDAQETPEGAPAAPAPSEGEN